MKEGYVQSKQAGFSTLELMIATVVLVIGLLPIIATIRRVSNGVTDRSSERITMLYAQSLLEQIRQKKWDENTVNATVLCTPTATNAIGLDGGETLPANVDDIDDYSGYQFSPHEGFISSVTVQYVALPFTNNAATVVSGTPTDFKLVRVTTTKVGPPPVISEVETIVCNGLKN